MNYKLSDYAKKFNVTYRTAWNRYKAGKINNAFIDNTGHVCIPIPTIDNDNSIKSVAIYARVSSNEMKENLNRQLDRLTNFAISNGFKINYSVKEIGSGLNDSRNKLISLLSKDGWDILIVENKDRLTRFGFNYIEALLNKMGKQIIVVNSNEDNIKKDLIEDLVSIIYSFSARIYGLRRAKNKQKEILNILNN